MWDVYKRQVVYVSDHNTVVKESNKWKVVVSMETFHFVNDFKYKS